jgi:hypothetical protein
MSSFLSFSIDLKSSIDEEEEESERGKITTISVDRTFSVHVLVVFDILSVIVVSD